MGREGGGKRDEFPVGMRVLAVDDDQTCLKVLKTMLLRCQYHVTTTNQAIKALQLLREKKDEFDLVISDVHMPDMDGFKLLELVGLEMDLPVIMLSANSDTKAVMKGITHGACDYLLKPVRLEEIKNIWQHVIRRKKFDHRDQNFNNDDCDKPENGNSEGGQGPVTSGSSDRKVNRKRKDQGEEGEDDNEDNLNENEDSSTQKKPRVVWSVELHQKFVAAVDQLGIDKAVPKRILDLMNVEKLTRENVASHLQKYRLYLKKRLSAAAGEQANVIAALGVSDPSFLSMASLDGFRDFHSVTTSGQLPPFPPYHSSGMLSRTNPTLLGLNGISPGLIQCGRIHNNGSDLVNDASKLQHNAGNQHGNLLQGLPTKLELDQFHKQRIQESNSRLSGVFSSGCMATGSSNNSIVSVTNNPILKQGHHSSIRIPSMSLDPFEMTLGAPSQLPALGNDIWQSSAQLARYAGNNLHMGSGPLVVASQANSNSLNFSSRNAAASPLSDPVIGNMVSVLRGTEEDSTYLNFRSLGNSQQKWGEVQQGHTNEPNIMFGSSLSHPLPSQSIVDHSTHNQRLNSSIFSRSSNTNMNSHTNFSAPFITQNCKLDKSTHDGQLKYESQHILDNSKLQGGVSSNGCNLDDLVNAMIKQR